MLEDFGTDPMVKCRGCWKKYPSKLISTYTVIDPRGKFKERQVKLCPHCKKDIQDYMPEIFDGEFIRLMK